jgi:HD-GYP domain-containing protein (c-di-GMP phosphodiesterase class II)
MREVPCTHLAIGDTLAEPVYGRNGIVMLEAGTVLTESYINRLKGLNIPRVYLSLVTGGIGTDSGPRDAAEAVRMAKSQLQMPDINRVKNDDTARLEAVQAAILFAESTRGLELVSPPIATEKFRRRFRDLMGEIVSNREFSDELGVILRTDSLLFEQAMQVTMYAGIIGTAKQYDTSQMYDLTLGAVFCDIGMTRLPTNLIKVNRDLTDSERLMVRRHTTEGYRVLTKMKGVPLEAAKVALQHHERYRGEGYPFGIKHNEISEYAQIVGLADVYNALVSPRHHRKPFATEEATEYLFASGNYEFDLSLIQTFLRHLRVYPVATPVMLSNGQTAFVVDTINRPMLRPVVQIIRESDGLPIPSPYLVDLQKESHLAIVRRIGEI